MAAACAAIAPLAPGRLTITTCWPQRCDRRSAKMRMITSAPTPAATGTMIETGRYG